MKYRREEDMFKKPQMTALVERMSEDDSSGLYVQPFEGTVFFSVITDVHRE